jgi:hypothetical protein
LKSESRPATIDPFDAFKGCNAASSDIMAVATPGTGMRRAPARFDRRISGRSVTPVDLWQAVQLAASGRPGIRCEGAAGVVVPSVADCSEEDLQRFVEGLNDCVTITAEEDAYQITHSYQVEPAGDDGGVTTAVTELRRDGRPVIVSLARMHYATGNDDSDAITARQDDLYLIDDADALGAVVFALLGQSAN